ncbi:MAG TPA: phosphoadenylyl-sulfate reductase [Candidatus Sulfotelmatobacter sp.]|jgi:phosphoadenosine phosphosulfate reductase|nr:phosphoadenylyl-sulfate reductase [Candidatus Sulfotelmatobacter sp.]
MSDLSRLRELYGHLDGKELLAALAAEFPGSLAVTSSFGAEAVVLLDLVAQVDPSLPVLFLDTNELFDETIAHRDEVIARLGLTGVRIIRPSKEELAEAEDLWRTDPDRCCHLRKVQPLERAQAGFKALVDGRKRFHGGGREDIATIEQSVDGVIKISPLAPWSQERIEAAFSERNLPRHPLVAQGYRSIGCWPCSRPSLPGESIRAGRWAGGAKTECGIHRTNK